ncbi:MAG: hypothetical protein M3Z01_07295 [Thermoproteota archaeon]|nr:hypothetical protein [Thermoproteota archaeon]
MDVAKNNLYLSINNNIRKITAVTAVVIITLLIIDLLTSRQLLQDGKLTTNTYETIIFILTVVIGYGIGSLTLLIYTGKISRDLRARSQFINVLYLSVNIIQFSLLGLLLFIIYNNSIYCHGYFNFCINSRISSVLVHVISSVAATVIMGAMSFKFFSWYISNPTRSFIVLFYGLASAMLAITIVGDIFDKVLLLQVIEEKTPAGTIPNSPFLYKHFDKYHGDIQVKMVNPGITILVVLPSSFKYLFTQVVYWTAAPPFMLTWAGTAMLLYYYFKRIGRANIQFWIIISIPLLLYIIGSGYTFSFPNDSLYRDYFRIIYRAGTITSSLLFGLAFFIVTRKLSAIKVKDYLNISAIGIIMIGIANSISALQMTYGSAGHSLNLLAAYLFGIGLYCSALSVSQDYAIRKSIKKSTLELIEPGS